MSEAARSTPPPPGLPLRAVLPNAITLVALCLGLTAVRFAFAQEWANAIAMVVIAGVLDGFDGRIARLLKAQSRFGAELDSLADNISFGTVPALILFAWVAAGADLSKSVTNFLWLAVLALAVCCALRLARFNSRIDSEWQPHKSAGFNTGVPAPAGAGLSFLPIYLWLVTGNDWFQDWRLVLPWTLFIAVLMISALPTYGWASFRIRRSVRLFALLGMALLVASLAVEPWVTLAAISLVYLATIPFGLASYAKVKRRRAAGAEPSAAG
ncbi:MAG TPA: phosphatidylcholine/phosphatidylserine synthase [Lautropia sp.]|nr:phosphatidylcholine/phosphatidylserine synthase [Lautropia sp.]